MDTQEVLLTPDGLQDAISQLEFLCTVKDEEVKEYLRDAQGSGVIDNAAYDEAKSQYIHLQARISELQELVAKAKVLQPSQTGAVALGSTVRVQVDGEREVEYTIVGSSFEANASGSIKRISKDSPVGKQLLNRRIGEMVIVSTPGGVKEYEILSIR
jgi:transcription elongation factor GreA